MCLVITYLLQLLTWYYRLATVASGAASGKLLQYEVGGPKVSVQTAYGLEVEVGNFELLNFRKTFSVLFLSLTILLLWFPLKRLLLIIVTNNFFLSFYSLFNFLSSITLRVVIQVD